MKNVVIISSSPRENGNSETLCKEFEKGAKESGNKVELIKVRDYKLNYCVGCFACHTLGYCFQDDGINEISKKLLSADVIVFATPVYFYSMSGQLKVLIDRLTPIYEKVKADIYLIATMWDPDKQMMDSTFEAIRGLTRDCFEGCNEKGVLYGANLGEKNETLNNKEYINQAYLMGKNC